MNNLTKLIGSAFIFLLLAVSVRAQVGNDNPTGISGIYNGNVTTAGSYDPYTSNATRSVTDISVAGAVGAYPLAFTRTMNSRVQHRFGNMGNGDRWQLAPQLPVE